MLDRFNRLQTETLSKMESNHRTNAATKRELQAILKQLEENKSLRDKIKTNVEREAKAEMARLDKQMLESELRRQGMEEEKAQRLARIEEVRSKRESVKAQIEAKKRELEERKQGIIEARKEREIVQAKLKEQQDCNTQMAMQNDELLKDITDKQERIDGFRDR